MKTRTSEGTYAGCDCPRTVTEIFNEYTQEWDKANAYCVPCDRQAIREGRMKPWPRWW